MTITNFDTINRGLFLGFVRVHILFHAAQEPIFGLDMIRELARHGYTLSPGTLYPILHGLERNGLLEVQKQVIAGKMRKYYVATDSGREVLAQALVQVRELLREIEPIA